jgi:hypothetical protein
MIRVLAVLAVLALIAAAPPLLARSRRRADGADLPDEHLGHFAVAGASRTWIVFTTPYCATCGPLMEEIGRTFPDDGLVALDGAEHGELATRLGVRRSPTVFEIDGGGRIRDRLIGADATRAHLPRVEPA